MDKKFFIHTFGCQMNVRDTEIISGLLINKGYKKVEDLDKADIVILNTCSVRQHAEDKVWSLIGRIKNNQKKEILLGVVGCMAQNYQNQIFIKAPSVDFVIGPSQIHKIPEVIEKLTYSPKIFTSKIWFTSFLKRPEDIYHTGFYQDKNHAYVVISEGCSNRCSYCIVPYVRGPLRNRDYKEILREIHKAIELGITKFTLLGQNVNAYEYGEVNFIKLIELVNSIREVEEFSFITSHPKDTTSELFKAMANLEKLKKYLHLPVQSGSDRILKLMNRQYTCDFYLRLVEDYRKFVKEGFLTTDIIVGFPTETEEDFYQTYDLVKNVKFNSAYIFKYSSRPHTEAEKLDDNVPKKEKERRHQLILELQKRISLASKKYSKNDCVSSRFL